MQVYDVVIIGAGHNGLTCAAYLGMAGLKVKVVERRPVVGGAAVTEEFCPGFRNSVAAYTVSLLNPKIIADLGLVGHGMRIVERRAQNFLPTLDGRHLLVAEDRTEGSIASFSHADAHRYSAFNRDLDASADLLRDLVLQAPPNLTRGGNLRAMGELLKAGRFGNRLRRLSTENLSTLFDLFTKSAGDYLDGWFEGELLKAWLGFDAIVGNYASPYTPGSAYVLLHHAFGEVNGKKRAWGHAIGGMGAITQAMARAAAGHGVEIETDAPVREVLIEKGRAAGVVLDGRPGRARHRGRRQRQSQAALHRDDSRERARSGLSAAHARLALWLRHVPHERRALGIAELHCLARARARRPPHRGDHPCTEPCLHGPRLWRCARARLEPRADHRDGHPLDPGRHPGAAGRHVASLFCQHVAPELPDGKAWNDHRDRVADLMIDTVDRYAPGFKASVIGRQALSPFDLEQMFGLTGGDIFHGALSLDQLFWARPALGYADYRGPLKGLYHCGSGAHPGGGVTGAPGHNAARAIIADRRWRVWPA